MKDKKHLLLPHFHRDTVAMKMKDTELNRIVEEKEMFRTKVEVLTKHNDEIKKEKASLSRIVIIENLMNSSLNKERNYWKKMLKDFWEPKRRVP